MPSSAEYYASKVPEVTIVFWIIKIAATTFGETGGDTVTMTLNWGYLVGTAIFLSLLLVLVICQIAAKTFHPILVLGNDRCLDHCGHHHGGFRRPLVGHRLRRRVVAFVACLMATLGIWYWSLGTISVSTVNTAKSGSVLLGRHNVLADPGNGSRRLDRRRFRPRLRRRSAVVRRRIGGDSPPRIAGAASRGSSYSGRHLFCRGRLEQRSATSSTSRSAMAAWR